MPSTLKSGLKVSLVSLILILSLVEVSNAHHHPGYYHDRRVMTRNPRWMTSLIDLVHVSELSIPGTHDTMARYGGPNGECQTLTLPDQLESGIRVLDIRCRHIGNAFAIHHGVFYQHANFDDVLKMTVDFLRRNPGETVLMRVKEEYNPTNNTRSFAETFHLRYWENEKYKDYLWKFTHWTSILNPTLGEIRGKIVILPNFPNTRTYGIPYNSFTIQDHYNLGSNHELYDKWLRVQKHLEEADKGRRDIKYMNYLSAAGKPFPFPYFVASGHSSPATRARRLATGRTTPGWNSWPDFPRLDCAWIPFKVCTIAFEGTNVLTHDRLGNYKNRVGIIMADFPGPGLIDRIIAFNNKFKNSSTAPPQRRLRTR